jgi:hypothetical protein
LIVRTSAWWRGLRKSTIWTVVLLAEVLDVRPSEIMRRAEELLPKQRGRVQARHV